MKYVLFVIWAVVLIFWGINLVDTYMYSTADPTMYYLAVSMYGIVVFMWGYALFHLHRYKRDCCWQCLTGEHKTCYLSKTNYKYSSPGYLGLLYFIQAKDIFRNVFIFSSKNPSCGQSISIRSSKRISNHQGS